MQKMDQEGPRMIQRDPDGPRSFQRDPEGFRSLKAFQAGFKGSFFLSQNRKSILDLGIGN